MNEYKQAYFLLFNGIKDITDALQYNENFENESFIIKLRQLQLDAEKIIIKEEERK